MAIVKYTIEYPKIKSYEKGIHGSSLKDAEQDAKEIAEMISKVHQLIAYLNKNPYSNTLHAIDLFYGPEYYRHVTQRTKKYRVIAIPYLFIHEQFNN